MVALKFDYGTCRLKDLRLNTEAGINGRQQVKSLGLHGEELKTTNRFWTSLQMRFGFTPNIFKYFGHAEVFTRISEKSPDDTIRYCIDRTGKADQLLAVTSPNSAVINYKELKDLLNRHGAEGHKYTNGVVSSTHKLRHDVPVQIAGDDFRSKYVIDTPIDGFGRPAVYLAMMRLICTNGAVAMTPVFRSELNCGKGTKGAGFALERAVEGFNNEEGFSALHQRFESSSKSWASVNEANQLYKIVAKMQITNNLSQTGGSGTDVLSDDTPVMHAFHKMTGDVSRLYGLTSSDVLSVKKQRTLPVRCRVYDLLNFASELATHRANPFANRELQGYIGDLVSAEYDLEGTAGSYGNWNDFFIKDERTIETINGMR
ncbi:hypothetical protein [Zavarzinella formosa]|uniref:hypothetical protein n=1 Tax=Zavarzinella formosa TaxID=360055 RepID=UPI00030E38F1|nr:hypothetical protein [Zavarzinella formosa]